MMQSHAKLNEHSVKSVDKKIVSTLSYQDNIQALNSAQRTLCVIANMLAALPKLPIASCTTQSGVTQRVESCLQSPSVNADNTAQQLPRDYLSGLNEDQQGQFKEIIKLMESYPRHSELFRALIKYKIKWKSGDAAISNDYSAKDVILTKMPLGSIILSHWHRNNPVIPAIFRWVVDHLSEDDLKIENNLEFSLTLFHETIALNNTEAFEILLDKVLNRKWIWVLSHRASEKNLENRHYENATPLLLALLTPCAQDNFEILDRLYACHIVHNISFNMSSQHHNHLLLLAQLASPNKLAVPKPWEREDAQADIPIPRCPGCFRCRAKVYIIKFLEQNNNPLEPINKVDKRLNINYVRNALFYAIRSNDFDVVQSLLAPLLKSPQMRATLLTATVTVKLKMIYFADVFLPRVNPKLAYEIITISYLTLAILSKGQGIAQYLLENGFAAQDAEEHLQHIQPLYAAIYTGNVEMVKLLLARNVSLSHLITLPNPARAFNFPSVKSPLPNNALNISHMLLEKIAQHDSGSIKNKLKLKKDINAILPLIKEAMVLEPERLKRDAEKKQRDELVRQEAEQRQLAELRASKLVEEEKQRERARKHQAKKERQHLQAEARAKEQHASAVEQARLETERQRIEAERQRAQEERQRAEAERLRIVAETKAQRRAEKQALLLAQQRQREAEKEAARLKAEQDEKSRLAAEAQRVQKAEEYVREKGRLRELQNVDPLLRVKEIAAEKREEAVRTKDLLNALTELDKRDEAAEAACRLHEVYALEQRTVQLAAPKQVVAVAMPVQKDAQELARETRMQKMAATLSRPVEFKPRVMQPNSKITLQAPRSTTAEYNRLKVEVAKREAELYLIRLRKLRAATETMIAVVPTIDTHEHSFYSFFAPPDSTEDTALTPPSFSPSNAPAASKQND